MFSEKVNAEVIQLHCETKSYMKNFGDEEWKIAKSPNWNLDIDIEKKLIVSQIKFSYKGKKYDVKNYFNIINIRENKLVALENKFSSEVKGLYTSSLTLNLSNGKMSFANHMNDYRGTAFSIVSANCK